MFWSGILTSKIIGATLQRVPTALLVVVIRDWTARFRGRIAWDRAAAQWQMLSAVRRLRQTRIQIFLLLREVEFADLLLAARFIDSAIVGLTQFSCRDFKSLNFKVET